MEKRQDLHGLNERLVVDTSEGHPVHLLIVGDNKTHLRLSSSAYYLLQQRHRGASFSQLAATFSQPHKPVSPADVEAAYQKVVEQIAEIERNPQLERSSFFLRFTLLPQSVVAPIANWLSIAFYKPVTYVLLACIAAAIAISSQYDMALTITPARFGWGYLLFWGSLLMHELGHASACARYGAQPSDIGFTFYWIWPALYSDVSTAWKLKRWQRVVVDLGGVFFQLLVAAGYAVLYTCTSWPPLKVALMLIAGSCFFSLNPVFKFDGYWMVADTLGVTNLGQQTPRIMRHWIHRFCRRPVDPLPWSPWVMAILAMYTVLSLGIWSYFLGRLLPTVWQILTRYPSQLSSILSEIHHWPPSMDPQSLQSFLQSTFIVMMTGLAIGRLSKLVPIAKLRSVIPKIMSG